MKLSPPASSSDIDAAREVARRLKLIATPPEPTRPLPDYAPLKGTRDGPPVPPRRPAPAAWEAAAPAPVPAASVPDPPKAPPTEVVEAPPPVPPSVPPPAPTPAPPNLAPAVVVNDEPPPPAPHVHEIPAPPVVEAAPEPPPPVVVEAPPVPSVRPAPAVAPPLPAEPPRPVAPEPPPAAVEEVEEIEEDLSPDEPSAAIEAAVAAPITWPEIVATCLSLAEAKGALVINPEGRVVAVSGDWPSPGAEAIAARLVPAMDKALKDAPTRSVSVPLGGVHLTAWRAPMAQGLVTVGFVAEAPLRPDLRPAIDAVVRKGS